MPDDAQESPIDAGRPTGTNGKPWFRPNQSGPGWLILGVVVAAIVVVVVLFRTGVL